MFLDCSPYFKIGLAGGVVSFVLAAGSFVLVWVYQCKNQSIGIRDPGNDRGLPVAQRAAPSSTWINPRTSRTTNKQRTNAAASSQSGHQTVVEAIPDRTSTHSGSAFHQCGHLGFSNGFSSVSKNI